MPLRSRAVRAARRRHRVAVALALPFLTAAAGGCGSLRAATRSDGAGTVQGGAPSSFVRSTSDTRSTRLIDLREGLTKPLAWRTALEVLGAEHQIDVRDE